MLTHLSNDVLCCVVQTYVRMTRVHTARATPRQGQRCVTATAAGPATAVAKVSSDVGDDNDDNSDVVVVSIEE